jgi:hypothetical protein
MKVNRVLILTGLLIITIAGPVYAAGMLMLDGRFDDWQGLPWIDDPSGDANNQTADLRLLFFGTNPDEAWLYFMAERWIGGAPPINLTLWIDTNNDSVFDGSIDRRVVVNYAPKNQRSLVDVRVFSGAGTFISSIATNADWGEPKDPGRKVEWGIPFADLGIGPGQTIRFYLESHGGQDRIPDLGDIQWSPADILGKPILAAILLAGAGLLSIPKQSQVYIFMSGWLRSHQKRVFRNCRNGIPDLRVKGCSHR